MIAATMWYLGFAFIGTFILYGYDQYLANKSRKIRYDVAKIKFKEDELRQKFPDKYTFDSQQAFALDPHGRLEVYPGDEYQFLRKDRTNKDRWFDFAIILATASLMPLIFPLSMIVLAKRYIVYWKDKDYKSDTKSYIDWYKIKKEHMKAGLEFIEDHKKKIEKRKQDEVDRVKAYQYWVGFANFDLEKEETHVLVY